MAPQIYTNIESNIMEGDWVKKVYHDFTDDPFGAHPYSITRMKDIVRSFMSKIRKPIYINIKHTTPHVSYPRNDKATQSGRVS